MLTSLSLFLEKTLEVLQEEPFPPVPCSLPWPKACLLMRFSHSVVLGSAGNSFFVAEWQLHGANSHR